MTIMDLKEVCKNSIASLMINNNRVYIGKVKDIPHAAERYKIKSVEVNENIIGHELLVIIEENKDRLYKASKKLPNGHIIETPYCKTEKEAQALLQMYIDEYEKE